MKVANPQGKGLVAIFKDWHSPMMIQEKRELPVLIRDYLFSLMVLSADFKFRPVQGKQYYLYLAKNTLKMTMIEPEKSGSRFCKFLGSCNLKPELTWQVTFSPDAQQDPELKQFTHSFFSGFEQHHQQSKSVLELLPFFQESLPFYARMYANGLAKSIAHGLDDLGITNIQAKELISLPEVSNNLLINKEK